MSKGVTSHVDKVLSRIVLKCYQDGGSIHLKWNCVVVVLCYRHLCVQEE